MLKSKAIGGPRNGVLLTCPKGWDGIVHKPISKNNLPTVPYPGRYHWQDGAWVWVEEKVGR